MKRMKTIWMVVALLLAVGPLASWLGPGAAAQVGSISGELRDRDGKPYPGVTIVMKSDEMGTTFEAKTDQSGRWLQAGVRSGIYSITVKVNNQVVYETKTRVETGGMAEVSINFKELISKQSAEQTEAIKKQEEEKKKFEGLKQHFDAGINALTEAKGVRTQIQTTPADQRGPLQQKANDLYGTAISEFKSAEQTAGETDKNRPVVLAKLGEAYELAGRYEEAADAYQKAIALKPDPGYYNNLGNTLAKTGKVEEAKAAYQKSVDLDPPNAANAWRNLGIVLYNNNRGKDAVEPLKKASELDPKNAQTWYLLGASLVQGMDFKQEGDKVIPILQPGTVEAYEKCIELEPNGPYAVEAKKGLEQLQAMGLGIETKIKSKTKKK